MHSEMWKVEKLPVEMSCYLASRPTERRGVWGAALFSRLNMSGLGRRADGGWVVGEQVGPLSQKLIGAILGRLVLPFLVRSS